MSVASIKGRVTALTLLLVGVVWLASIAWTWQAARHEAEEIFDAHLAQSAALLLVQAGLLQTLGQ